MNKPKIAALALGFGLVLAGAGAPAIAGQEGDHSRWDDIRVALFGDRVVKDGEGMVALDLPARAHDAAIVPVSMRVDLPTEGQRAIRKLYLVVDHNPSPLAGVFHFGAGMVVGDISTRIRIDEYTYVRAIAETADGELLATSRFIRAAGGCSAPAGKDQLEALKRLGRIKLNIAGDVQLDQPVDAQVLVSHPNNSGLQFDQISRLYIPPHFVTTMKISYGGEPVLTLESDIAMSEDPSVHFRFVPRAKGELKVEVVDSKDANYSQAWPIEPKTGM